MSTNFPMKPVSPILLLAALMAGLFTPAASHAQAPNVISYQGRITSNGTGFSGTGQFRFVMYRAGPPMTSSWSHDGSSVGASMPLTAVSLPVSGGLFSIGLGDTAVPGMLLPVSPATFAASGLRIRIWFSDGVAAPSPIADHPITSVGYAMMAMSVPDGSLTSSKLAPGAIGSAQLANDVSFSLVRLNELGPDTITLNASTGAGEGALLTMRNGLGAATATLDSDTTGERGSSFTLYNSAGIGAFSLNSDNIGESATLSLRTSANIETVQLLASPGGGEGSLLTLRNGAGTATLTLDADASGNAASIAIYNGAAKLAVLIDGDEGSGIGGSISVYNSAGLQRAELDGQGASGGGELVLRDEDGTSTVVIEAAEGAGNGAQIALYKGAGGSPTIVLDADQAGEGRITTQVLEITGGSDFSESFDIRSEGALPGMIVSIDAAHPGELAVSGRAYDRTVAGIVSGAGGVKPGLMMGQRGTAADGKHPVALTGRVYCLVDAERGAIEPGDLITTSDTPGHGMKVTEHARAQGAIIGKAMTPLAAGRGLVLVLVSLQ